MQPIIPAEVIASNASAR
jgi:hypothetical protein